jgi:formylmethanofuran dehydrogenase subunit D
MQKPKLQVILLTGRTIEQGVGKELGKTSEDYFKSAASCFIDPADLKYLNVKDGDNVRVSTEYGSVIVKSLCSPQAPHRGIVFIPYGLWANAVVSAETGSIGMPSLKGTPATLEAAENEHVQGLRELLTKQFGKKTDANH